MSRTDSQNLNSTLSVNAQAANANLDVPGSATFNSNTGTATFRFGGNNYNVNLVLQALETDGLVRTLAEPNLIALSGQPARFLAGGEVPIPVQNPEGGISVQYRPFGVELIFTPTVVDEDIINLQMDASVSSIGEDQKIGESSVPRFVSRETSSTVELRDGQSFAIAGILQDEFRDSATQVPFLGDVPILGALFRSANYQRSQTELVIIITAHLVSPTSGEALALPTDRVRPPTENELFLYGRVAGDTSNATRRSTRGGEAATQDFSGNYGYVME